MLDPDGLSMVVLPKQPPVKQYRKSSDIYHYWLYFELKCQMLENPAGFDFMHKYHIKSLYFMGNKVLVSSLSLVDDKNIAGSAGTKKTKNVSHEYTPICTNFKRKKRCLPFCSAKI